MHFIASSLEKLVRNLDRSMFRHTSKYSTDQVELMLKKGIYPYEYIDGKEKLDETQLPSKEKFYSSLSETNISDEDYEHAQKVWKTFSCQTLADYTRLYCKSDVLLLADVFENFTDVSLEKYKLDPAHYYITAPALALDAMLKMNEVQLELLTDPDMFLFFERGVRGGVSMITKKYAKANNHYMGNDYDPSMPSAYIPYLDANLYGWAMSQPLPHSKFEWLSEKEILEMTTDHSKIQKCTLEVDIEYPSHLHDLHNDYPLAPESIVVNKVEKLIPNLNDKINYVVHHSMLQQCLKRGLILKKVHRGIKYQERTFLKTYIDSNTASRTSAKSDFEKDFFKLMNNSVFGKTMENVRLRCSIEIANGSDEKRIECLIATPNYKSGYIFENSNLASMRMGKTKVMMNKPIYLGASILDLSKTLMYDFHYDYVKPKYGDKPELLFRDTDSLCYEIEMMDFFRDIAPDVETMFDTSNFSKNHPSGIPTAKTKRSSVSLRRRWVEKLLMSFADCEQNATQPKCTKDRKWKKCKGVKKAVVKTKLTIDDNKRCLFENEIQRTSFNTLRSRKHEISTQTITKISLTPNDDKRHAIENYRTLALGHYKLIE